LWFPKLQYDIDFLHLTTWREMCAQLEKKGHEVKLGIAAYPGTLSYVVNIPILKKIILRAFSFWINGFRQYRRTLIAFKPDTVILDVYTFWFNIFTPRFQKKSCVFVLDNRTPIYHVTSSAPRLIRWIMSIYTRLCYAYTRRFLNGVTVITEYYKKELSRKYSIDPESICVWSSGVDVDRFSLNLQELAPRPEFLADKFVVFQHGELSCNRGLSETIAAFSHLAEQKIVLLLIGKGPAYRQLQQQSESLGLKERIFFLPPVPYEDIPENIAFCDCAVMAYPDNDYWNKNNPIKLLEYLAMGKTVICTDSLTFRSVIGSAACGEYLTDNQPTTIAAAISKCYQQRAWLNARGKEGAVLARESYTWQKQANKLASFLERLKND